jgi:hypothetical protein
MTRFQRFRWAALGAVLGAVATVATFVVASIATPDPSDVDVSDAAKVADNWARDHERPGEGNPAPECTAEAGVSADRFACYVRYEPTARKVTLFIQTVVGDGKYEAAVIEVRPGVHEIPDFHERP